MVLVYRNIFMVHFTMPTPKSHQYKLENMKNEPNNTQIPYYSPVGARNPNRIVTTTAPNFKGPEQYQKDFWAVTS